MRSPYASLRTLSTAASTATPKTTDCAQRDANAMTVHAGEMTVYAGEEDGACR